jgi:3-oxoacyl-(acyl-carrier-protein) synthase
MPLGRDDIGVALGVEEGIDGIKARYYRELLTEGPLGASPIAFPFTAPNTIAARLSILLDLRGENFTVCGGSLSGAQAIGLALESLREGRCAAVLTGGATSVEQEHLDALRHLGQPSGGQTECGACLLLLERRTSADESGGAGQMLGYAEGFGKEDIRHAIQACLEDAGLFPEQIGSVRISSASDLRSLVETLRKVVARAPVIRSPSSRLHSASFPMAVAEAVGQGADGMQGPVLVVGTDCLVGASASIVRGGRG